LGSNARWLVDSRVAFTLKTVDIKALTIFVVCRKLSLAKTASNVGARGSIVPGKVIVSNSQNVLGRSADFGGRFGRKLRRMSKIWCDSFGFPGMRISVVWRGAATQKTLIRRTITLKTAAFIMATYL